MRINYRFYDYTVILASSFGHHQSCYNDYVRSSDARIGWAVRPFILGMSGLLDTFDGKVARTKKNRTEDQKRFGIQIDSLCDIVCFGVCPVIICWFSLLILPKRTTNKFAARSRCTSKAKQYLSAFFFDLEGG